MICACTVTSSAVVGSSAISSLRIQRERHRDHRPLPHAARELVRVVVDAPLGPRDPDQAEQLDRPLRAPAARATSSCTLDHLRDLPADPVVRMQARERILEDHRDPGAAHRAQLLGGHGEQVAPLEQRAARDASRPASARRSSGAATLLPEPDSPTMPSVRPRSTANETPRTAWTTPSPVWNETARSRTSSSRAVSGVLEARSALTEAAACSRSRNGAHWRHCQPDVGRVAAEREEEEVAALHAVDEW